MLDVPVKSDPKRLARAELIVYDLDGTLVNAFEDIWLSVNEVMRRHALPEHVFEQVRAYVGEGSAELIRRCLGPAHMDRFEAVHADYRRIYAAHPVRRARCYPGVPETLERIAAHGIAQAILTNKPVEISRRVVAQLGLEAWIDGVWGQSGQTPLKPDPEAFSRVMRFFGVAPGPTVMVGDHRPDHGVARATSAGLAMVTWGILDRPAIESLDPDAIIDHMTQLPGLIGIDAFGNLPPEDPPPYA